MLFKLEPLICCEWGYVPLDCEEAQLLFQVISDFYERISVIITTNLEFSRWGSVFCNEQLA
ncbi:MAG TPA: ATP-binding protein [Clostridiales bacterium]|nr:ATP-binding protein [Clostridiales bacterium]